MAKVKDKSPFPVYRLDLSLAFPELKSKLQTTVDTTYRASALSLVLAYVMSGNLLTGVLADLTPEDIFHEVEAAARALGIPIDRLMSWAESILISPEATADLAVVSERSEAKKFTLSHYQRATAAWSAHRMGSVQALGCGIGKSATSTAAAIAALRLKKCSMKRCHILSPLNAMPQWEAYADELRDHFAEVMVLSCDSLHLYQYVDRAPGGALIIDEAHKLKNFGADRSGHAHAYRGAFDWCVALTGTLLHTGPEGVMSILNLACPGLARFLDKWAYGEAFDCIITKVLPGTAIKKQVLGIPPQRARAAFELYLSRGVKSLSFQSPEVRAEIQLPDQHQEIVSTWEKPDWVQLLPTEKHFEDVQSKYDGFDQEVTFEHIIKEKCWVLWPPEIPWRLLLPAIATGTFFEDMDAWKLRNNPEEKQPGLPHFSGILHRISKLGWVETCLQYSTDHWTGISGFKFVYPGDDATAGPKIRWVIDWLKEHPKESLVVGAQAVQTIDMMRAALIEARVSHELIRGGVPLNDRKRFVDGFQAGKFRVQLLQQVAGSESVTLTRATNSVLIDHDWSPIPYTQFLARTSRRGQEKECWHFDLSFCDMQTEIILRLIRGDEFDAETRANIEKLVNVANWIARKAEA